MIASYRRDRYGGSPGWVRGAVATQCALQGDHRTLTSKVSGRQWKGSAFRHYIFTQIEIDAPAEEVWSCLVHFPTYEQWKPMLRKVATQLQADAAVKFEVLQNGAGPLKLNARITALRPPESLARRGGSRLALAGDHVFLIGPLDGGRCRFDHGEYFSGALLPGAIAT